MGRATLYFDGSYGWGRKGCYGWHVSFTDRLPAEGRGTVDWQGVVSCNVSEWFALGHGLRYLADQGWTGQLHIYGDSKLVVEQLSGRWKCHKPHLRRLRDRCRVLLRSVAGRDWQIAWVPRERNQQADALSRPEKIFP